MNVLITGATKGIGRAIAIKMASNGCNLALCARSYDDLSALKELIEKNNPSAKIYIKAIDCSQKLQVLQFAEEVIKQYEFIDVLVNNVGVFQPSRILDEQEDALLNQMNVNLYAPYYLYKKIGVLMREARKGTIINICSVASKETIVDAGSYCVTKAALLSLNHLMREELREYDVKVTAILPGSTLTYSWEGTHISPDKFVQPTDVADIVDMVLSLSKGANVDEITLKPVKFIGE